ncbi:hypothetical protein K470DRAFT_135856 [Piedraia hortae CBS 480.64]|uniref:Uncharacterized protein n=1 Tax=Piedraia hortae CBS 480.64 TaxID=1314780 RepID=A0A6A7BUA1_9PEZI|nr:hypothetical protein K470DRAFT_135856 [Piedraia hortae CBS 480.64]
MPQPRPRSSRSLFKQPLPTIVEQQWASSSSSSPPTTKEIYTLPTSSLPKRSSSIGQTANPPPEHPDRSKHEATLPKMILSIHPETTTVTPGFTIRGQINLSLAAQSTVTHFEVSLHGTELIPSHEPHTFFSTRAATLPVPRGMIQVLQLPFTILGTLLPRNLPPTFFSEVVNVRYTLHSTAIVTVDAKSFKLLASREVTLISPPPPLGAGSDVLGSPTLASNKGLTARLDRITFPTGGNLRVHLSFSSKWTGTGVVTLELIREILLGTLRDVVDRGVESVVATVNYSVVMDERDVSITLNLPRSGSGFERFPSGTLEVRFILRVRVKGQREAGVTLPVSLVDVESLLRGEGGGTLRGSRTIDGINLGGGRDVRAVKSLDVIGGKPDGRKEAVTDVRGSGNGGGRDQPRGFWSWERWRGLIGREQRL